MARHRSSLRIRRTIDEVFELVGDLRNAPAWDPQTIAVTKLTSGPVGVGTRFLLIGRVAGLRLELPYEVEQHDPPHGLVLVGGTARLRYCDRITLCPEDGGTRLDYDATLELVGRLRVAEPLLRLVFGWIGARATRRMAEAVERAP